MRHWLEAFGLLWGGMLVCALLGLGWHLIAG